MTLQAQAPFSSSLDVKVIIVKDPDGGPLLKIFDERFKLERRKFSLCLFDLVTGGKVRQEKQQCINKART